ncbi:MAG TPA: cytochrome b/b6 domain-containing protein [Methylovirgula sp.]
MSQTVTDPIVLEQGHAPQRIAIRKHGVVVRITHWINAFAWIFLLMSGLQIFNAHPALYWGQQSNFAHPFLAMTASDQTPPQGITSIEGHAFNTTGWFGLSKVNGQPQERGFPAFMTWPGQQDLATGRGWHFFFAWLLVINGFFYLVSGFVSRHFARDLWPSWADIRHIPRSVWDHARLRFPHHRDYNVLQKLAYLSAGLLALPLMVLTGLTMSPAFNAACPWLLELFGGRQSARTIHFITAMALVLFVVVHIVMVLISGVFNNLRSMITGRYVVDEETSDAAQ